MNIWKEDRSAELFFKGWLFHHVTMYVEDNCLEENKEMMLLHRENSSTFSE